MSKNESVARIAGSIDPDESVTYEYRTGKTLSTGAVTVGELVAIGRYVTETITARFQRAVALTRFKNAHQGMSSRVIVAMLAMVGIGTNQSAVSRGLRAVGLYAAMTGDDLGSVDIDAVSADDVRVRAVADILTLVETATGKGAASALKESLNVETLGAMGDSPERLDEALSAIESAKTERALKARAERSETIAAPVQNAPDADDTTALERIADHVGKLASALAGFKPGERTDVERVALGSLAESAAAILRAVETLSATPAPVKPASAKPRKRTPAAAAA